MDNKDWSGILAAWSRWVAGEGPPVEYYEGCGRWLQWTDKESISKCRGMNWRVASTLMIARFKYTPGLPNLGVTVLFRESGTPLPTANSGSVYFGPDFVIEDDDDGNKNLMKLDQGNLVRLHDGPGGVEFQIWNDGESAPALPPKCKVLSNWIHLPTRHPL